MATKSGGFAPIRIITAPVNRNNVEALRKLNASTFPVSYNQKFYDDVLNTPGSVTMLGYYKETIVAAICCRIEEKDGVKQIYIMTLCVLAAYRRRGVGSFLLDKALKAVQTAPELKDVKAMYLHVQTNNDAALEFYKKAGFNIEDTLKGYYKHIEPPDCHILRKHFDDAERVDLE
jgi:ribosomal protein S18 acetylase RimI-like enzyme